MYIKVVEAEYINSLDNAYEKGLKEGKDFNKDNQNLNYRVGYNDGWHDCEASFELGNKFTDSIQEQAYDEGFVEGYNQHEYETYQNLSEKEKVLKAEAWDDGYDQAIDDLIEAGVIGEEEYPDDGCSDECYSEYEFGDVDDDEEEYCFSKELEKVLNGDFTSNINFDVGNKEEMVNHPKHYNSDLSGVECIEVARYRNFNVGSALKYLWRCGLKNGNSDIQDLEKAVWYLNDEIKSLKRGR